MKSTSSMRFAIVTVNSLLEANTFYRFNSTKAFRGNKASFRYQIMQSIKPGFFLKTVYDILTADVFVPG